jgi:hypothetical protein
MDRMNKRRIAVCFYGQTRLYELLNNYYSKWNEQDDYQFDFFVHTWDDFSDKSCFDYFTETEFGDPSKLDLTTTNCVLMTFSLQKVNLLKLNYELNNNFVYDYVIATRTDVLMDFSKVIDILNENIDSSPLLQIMACDDIKNQNGSWHLSSDFIFFGTSKALDLHSMIYKDCYLLKIPFDARNGGHTLHATSIMKNRLNFKRISLPHGIIRPQRDEKILKENLHLDDIELLSLIGGEGKKWKWIDANKMERDGKVVEFKGRLIK